MGLDVYLYKYQDLSESERKEELYEEYSNESWGNRKYESIPEAEREQISAKNKAYATELGLGEWGSDDEGREGIEFPSTKYPDHYFKVGYFRSSYNDGGINRVLGNLGVPDLYKIFSDPKDYRFKPDWEKAKKKCIASISLLKSKANYRCFDISWNSFKNPNDCEITDEKKAMEVFLKEIKTHKEGGYSNINGHFYHSEPIKVLALVSGVQKMLLNDIMLPCTYVICEGENEWYIQALEIVLETIEYVLNQPDKDKYILHWSS